MSGLPRLLCYLDDTIAARDDLGVLLAAAAAAGPEAALVARLPHGTSDALARLAERAVANARPPHARVFVTGRADIALAVGADGCIARRDDLAIADLMAVGPHLTFLASVHSVAEAFAAREAGAHGIIVGNIWPTASHPGRDAAGIALLREVIALGLPTWAIGGVTPATAREAAAAGAFGVAAISAIWGDRRPYAAAKALLDGIRFRPSA